MIHRRLAQTLDVSIAITQSMATTVSIARVITAIVIMAIVSIVVTVSIVIIASIAPHSEHSHTTVARAASMGHGYSPGDSSVPRFCRVFPDHLMISKWLSLDIVQIYLEPERVAAYHPPVAKAAPRPQSCARSSSRSSPT